MGACELTSSARKAVQRDEQQALWVKCSRVQVAMSAIDRNIYELRKYAIAPGRLPDMVGRFVDDLSILFPRHGIGVVGAWVAMAGPSMPTFVYLMRWENLEQRNASFKGFAADRDWHEARARSNGPSELVEHYDIQLLTCLDATGLEGAGSSDPTNGIELTLYCAANGCGPEMRESLLAHEIPARTRRGAEPIGTFEPITGPRLPGLVSILRWPDAQTWSRVQDDLDADDALRARRLAEIASYGRTVLGHADRFLMQPVAYRPRPA